MIGPGITGCSVSQALLSHAALDNARIMVLEARSLTSGATGRNGGHLASSAVVDLADLVEYGREQAAATAKFSFACIDRLHEMAATHIDEEAYRAAEVRKVSGIMVFRDNDSWDCFKATLKMFEEELPEFRDRYRLLETEEELKVRLLLH